VGRPGHGYIERVPAVSAPCRSCGAPLRLSVVDLGLQPLANSFVTVDQLERAEPRYPLCVYVCDRCWLMQIDGEPVPEEIFNDYAYFSSYSDSWLEHARRYSEEMIERLGLGEHSLVLEVASNDGYLLRNFVERGIRALGVDPAANVAEAAVAAGVPTEVAFFGRKTGEGLRSRGVRADLLIANNVLAHVPDVNDFVAGLATVLAPGGILTAEFHHVLRLLEGRQFDTIYHEHYSYLSLTSAKTILARHGLTVLDVDEIPTHGGSLRVYAAHEGEEAASVGELLEREQTAGLTAPAPYERLSAVAESIKQDLLAFLEAARADGRRVVAYGAPAKGNTLLNYCGISTDLVLFTVDRSPHKQGRFLPGSHLPIHAPDRIFEARPDYVLLLAWNLKDEIVEQMSAVREWGGRFVVPIPEVSILS
jgi:SAM-dependent methyltransferase